MNKHKNRPILVIDPAVKNPELITFNHLAQTSQVPLTYHLPALFGLQSLQKTKPEQVRGIIILGSLSSVNEKLSWQENLGLFLRPFLAEKTPVLGLCFGHQFIAHLFGGKVQHVFPDQKKHLGFRKVQLKENPLWGERREGELYVSHNEHVVTVPKDFSVSAESPEIAIEGLAHNHLPIWSFQPHPEAGPKFQEVREDQSHLSDPKKFEFGNSLVGAFLRFCSRND